MRFRPIPLRSDVIRAQTAAANVSESWPYCNARVRLPASDTRTAPVDASPSSRHAIAGRMEQFLPFVGDAHHPGDDVGRVGTSTSTCRSPSSIRQSTVTRPWGVSRDADAQVGSPPGYGASRIREYPGASGEIPPVVRYI